MGIVYGIGYTFFRGLAQLFYGYNVVNRERLVQEGPMLVACNHVSFFDPPMVGIAYDDSIFYLARKSLFRGPFRWIYTNWNAIPVDQENPDYSGLKNIVRLLKQGERVLLFPEGQRSESGELDKGEAGVGLVVAKAKVPVQPVRIFGAYEIMPIGQKIPKCTGKITVVVGDPIYFTPEELKVKGRDAYQAISERIMAAIAEIELPEK